MKNKSSLIYVFAAAFFCCGNTVLSQKNKEKSLDSALEANTEKWQVKQHSGITGLAKPEFGSYTTLVAEKLDSTVTKTKSKDGSEASYSSYDGWDISKYKTFEKKKFYRMVLGKEADTIEMQFYVHSVSNEKRETMLSKMLRKNDETGESRDATIGYKKNIGGILFTAQSTPAHFFIEDYLSTRQITGNPGQSDPITGGYILIKNDSLYTEPVIQTFGSRKIKFFLELQKGIFINDAKGRHIALLQFGDKPFYVRMFKDIDVDYQDAIASFFAVIIGCWSL